MERGVESANYWTGVIDPGLALGQIPRAPEVDSRPQLGETVLLKAIDEIGHRLFHLKMRSGVDPKSFVEKPRG
jgi:hypothetical protein